MNIIAAPRRGAKPGWTPAERPRGVQPARLACAPGTSRRVLDDLFGIEPRTDAEFAAAMTAWQTEVAKIETNTMAALAAIDARITFALDGEYNAEVFAVHHMTTPVLEQLRDIERDLVDAVAEWIVAEVATDAALFGAKETRAEVPV